MYGERKKTTLVACVCWREFLFCVCSRVFCLPVQDAVRIVLYGGGTGVGSLVAFLN